ncbi:Ada metal-binding domain-containing protein [Micromonospora coriariae]|uniref:Ada metal-binding domain-containing protein n=1 Tax=Micromonospora coriariae TaxID=285665 RepID=UPI000B5AD2E4|nr:Ada metal-binding domain-containing protein [Micromonospora coriariae]
MLGDPQSQYEAIQRREERLDGSFLTAVKTTGTYCRPSCRAKTPRTQNVDFHPTAASAQLAGRPRRRLTATCSPCRARIR